MAVQFDPASARQMPSASCANSQISAEKCIGNVQVRRVLDVIRGRSYEEALMILEYSPWRACELITKTLVSVRLSSLPFFLDPII